MPSESDNPESSIIDQIDALVEDQLTHERSGYDHNVHQPPCPLCGDFWHGLRQVSSGCPGAYATGAEVDEWVGEVKDKTQAVVENLTDLFDLGADPFGSLTAFFESILGPFAEWLTDFFGGIDLTELSAAIQSMNLDQVPNLLDSQSFEGFEIMESSGQEPPPL